MITQPQQVNLGDAITPVGKWGSLLEIYVGNFAGTSQSDILLYNPIAGTIQLLSLNLNLTIKQHVVLRNIGTDWEMYVGRLDGQRSALFMYKRYAVSAPAAAATATPEPIQTQPYNPSTSTSQPTATATPKPTATATPEPTATAKPTATVTPEPTATAKPTATATPEPTATAKPTATATPEPTATATPEPTATATVTTSSAATATPEPTPTTTSAVGSATDLSVVDYALTIGTATPAVGDLSASTLQDQTADVRVLDFNQNFSIRHSQQYTSWYANWEVYVGSFVSAKQDGIFLYDRQSGEGRLMDFSANLDIVDYQAVHNLTGNWTVYSGDFIGTGRAQLLLYDPSSGSVEMMSFAKHLALVSQASLANFGTNEVLYVGHFGTATLSVMLYDPQNAQSTFVMFDKSFTIAHEYLVPSWDQSWQILTGDFVDHARCQSAGDCATSDDILLLNRQTGQLKQYVFIFGRKFQVYDNRAQAFEREGLSDQQYVSSVDTTTFSLVNSQSTSIRDEELY